MDSTGLCGIGSGLGQSNPLGLCAMCMDIGHCEGAGMRQNTGKGVEKMNGKIDELIETCNSIGTFIIRFTFKTLIPYCFLFLKIMVVAAVVIQLWDKILVFCIVVAVVKFIAAKLR